MNAAIFFKLMAIRNKNSSSGEDSDDNYDYIFEFNQTDVTAVLSGASFTSLATGNSLSYVDSYEVDGVTNTVKGTFEAGSSSLSTFIFPTTGTHKFKLKLNNTTGQSFSFAFNSCSQLVHTLKVMDNDDYTSYNACPNLLSITMPYTYDTINNWQVYDNPLLSSIYGFSDNPNITSINGESFAWDKALKLDKLPDNITRFSWKSFQGCSVLGLSSLPSGITSISNNVFQYTDCSFDNNALANVTSIGSEAFHSCKNLNVTQLNDSLETLEYAVFAWSNLALTKLPNKLETILGWALGGTECSFINIPSSVTAINTSAFAQCNNLTTITFDGTPNYIAGDAFNNCNNLKKINCPWASGAVSDAPWGASNATIVYDYGKSSVCLAEGTLITLANGSTKPIEDVRYTDNLLVWDFDEGKFSSARPAWLLKHSYTDEYLLSKYENGSELRTIGSYVPNKHHRVFDADLQKFVYTDDAVNHNVGTINGTSKMISAEVIKKPVAYYNIITERHFNCFANGILTSNRFSNMYEIEDMKYKKMKRNTDMSVYINIPDYYIKAFRLAEQPKDLSVHVKYLLDRQLF